MSIDPSVARRDKALPGPLLAGPNPLPPASKRKRSRTRRAAYALLAPLLYGFARLLWSTLRVRVTGGAELDARLARGEPVVLAFWHAELYACVMHLRARYATADARLVFLVSPSIDGDLVTRIVELGKGRVVRGSATRDSVKSLRDLYRVMTRERASPLIACDGPHGPALEAKPGAILLAQLARAPVVPVAADVRGGLRLPTWDRLIVPLPFARVDVRVGAFVDVGGPCDGAELESLRVMLEREHLTR